MSEPAAPPSAPIRPVSRPGLWLALLLVLCAVLAGLLAWTLLRGPGRLSETAIRAAVVSTIEREAEASFLVTGTLDVGTTAETRSTTTVLPGLLNMRVGSTDVTVRVPGRVAYGFDVRGLAPQDIRVLEDGTVEVRLPPPSVFSVEPDLERAEVRAAAGGWERLSREPERRTTAMALQQVRPAMREQAEAYLARAEQPRLNTAEALARMLTPPLVAAGVREPRFRFLVGPETTVEFDGAARRHVRPLPAP